MADHSQPSYSLTDTKPAIRPITVFISMFGIFAGAIIGLYMLPDWLPWLNQSIAGAQPKVFWYLARGSAVIAYLLLWFTMVLGVTVTNKLVMKWPGLAKSNELHQYLSILGLSFGLFHGLVLLGDQFMNFSLWQIFVPFSTVSYRPLIVGLGQLGFYAWLVLVISFYVRKKIGAKGWRKIHFASYFTFLAVLVHAIIGGTDASLPWMQLVYWITGGLLLFFTIYRILYEIDQKRERKERQQEQIAISANNR